MILPKNLKETAQWIKEVPQVPRERKIKWLTELFPTIWCVDAGEFLDEK